MLCWSVVDQVRLLWYMMKVPSHSAAFALLMWGRGLGAMPEGITCQSSHQWINVWVRWPLPSFLFNAHKHAILNINEALPASPLVQLCVCVRWAHCDCRPPKKCNFAKGRHNPIQTRALDSQKYIHWLLQLNLSCSILTKGDLDLFPIHLKQTNMPGH